MSTLTTSVAVEQPIKLYDYDDVNIAQIFTDDADAAIDITDYKFEFKLMKADSVVTTYSIDAGDLTSEFLTKENTNELRIKNMVVDIRTKIKPGSPKVRLLEIVTDNLGTQYVYIEFPIDAKQH